MHIKVINLARALDRRKAMESKAVRLGLTLDFIEATDARNLTDAERGLVDIERRKRVSPYPLSDGEIACWISHRRVMQELVDSGDKMVCILEDDASPSPDLMRVLQAVESSALTFDVIDLHRKFTKSEVFAPCRSLQNGYSLGRVGLMHMGAIAYVISYAGAQKFLAYAPRFAHVIDKEMHRYWANGLDIYGLDRPVVFHDDGGKSYIDDTRKQDKPEERIPFPDAYRLRWRLARTWERMKDSIAKRAAFPFFYRFNQRD